MARPVAPGEGVTHGDGVCDGLSKATGAILRRPVAEQAGLEGRTEAGPEAGIGSAAESYFRFVPGQGGASPA